MRGGRVIDSSNNPLPFATITWEVTGGYTGTTADYNGYFTVPDELTGAVMVSYVGCSSKAFNVDGLAVVGYGLDTTNINLGDCSTSVQDVVITECKKGSFKISKNKCMNYIQLFLNIGAILFVLYIIKKAIKK